MKVKITSRAGEHRFDAETGERILYAGLHGGLNLPYECATGTCGTCKARLISGEIEDLWPDAPGKKNLKPDQGHFLMCQCAAKGDVVAEVAQFVTSLRPLAGAPQWCEGTIRNTRLLTPDVISLQIELDHPISFEAGQFMAVEVSDITGLRGYSMVNFSSDSSVLDFVIKKFPGGALSNWLFLGSRDEVRAQLFGPLGAATFHPEIAKNLLCIAGGTGIAGIMSILDRACQTGYFERFEGDVFFGVRTPADAFYLEELASFQASFPNSLRITVAFSDQPATDELRSRYPSIRFAEGFVHEVAGKDMAGRFGNVMAYLAGPPPAVDASIRLLIMAGVGADSIKYDKFS